MPRWSRVGCLIGDAGCVPRNALQMPANEREIHIDGRIFRPRRELRKLLRQNSAFGADWRFLSPYRNGPSDTKGYASRRLLPLSMLGPNNGRRGALP
jgi:hypothetical protein